MSSIARILFPVVTIWWREIHQISASAEPFSQRNCATIGILASAGWRVKRFIPSVGTSYRDKLYFLFLPRRLDAHPVIHGDFFNHRRGARPTGRISSRRSSCSGFQMERRLRTSVWRNYIGARTRRTFSLAVANYWYPPWLRIHSVNSWRDGASEFWADELGVGDCVADGFDARISRCDESYPHPDLAAIRGVFPDSRSVASA